MNYKMTELKDSRVPLMDFDAWYESTHDHAWHEVQTEWEVGKGLKQFVNATREYSVYVAKYINR
jgi:hypothetical protein